MGFVVKLSAVLEAIELVDNTSEYFLDRRTGEIILMTEDIRFAMDEADDLDEIEDWMREPIQKYKEIEDTEDCLPLPTQYEIHEYRIMEDFIGTIQDLRLQQELQYAIQGKGAFRNFKDRVYRRGIEEQWFAFRNNAMRKIAIDWLNDHELAFTED